MTTPEPREDHELAACPFCGGQGAIEKLPKIAASLPNWRVSVEHDEDCLIASAADYIPMHYTRAEAIAAWNTRAPAVSEEAGWQPIETAKENEWVLCYEPSGHPDIRGDYYAGCKIGEGDDAYWMSACGQYVTTSPEPTHCRPLPPPPTTPTEEPQS